MGTRGGGHRRDRERLASRADPGPADLRGADAAVALEPAGGTLHRHSLTLHRRGVPRLKRAQDPNFKAPSLAWFSKWWKDN